jgi:hypothetical protein
LLILDINDYMIKYSKKILTNKFDMKDFSVVDVILRIKINRTYDGFVLSQFYYIEKNFDKFSKSNNNIVKTLINISVYLSKNKGERIY